MNFINSIDFTLVGLVLCFLFEAMGKSFNRYSKALDLNRWMEATTPKELPGGMCLFGLFYMVFTIVMLWNPYLWFPAVLLLALGVTTGIPTKVMTTNIGKYMKLRYKPTHAAVTTLKSKIKAIFIIDKLISLALLGWMIYLHLEVLGLIK
jgi:hypothetical protein